MGGVLKENLIRGFLLLHNFACSFLWGVVLYYSILPIFKEDKKIFFETVGTTTLVPVMIAQTAAILEILHAMLGLVRSNVLTTSMQVLSRLHIVYLIWGNVYVTRLNPWYFACILSWTLSELIRYPYYITNLFFPSFHWWKWLRYSAFFVLYPVGIASEIASIIIALPTLQTDPNLSAFPYRMPNSLNFQISLGWVYIFILTVYIPGSYHMMRHMIKQRNKYLHGDFLSKKTE